MAKNDAQWWPKWMESYPESLTTPYRTHSGGRDLSQICTTDRSSVDTTDRTLRPDARSCSGETVPRDFASIGSLLMVTSTSVASACRTGAGKQGSVRHFGRDQEQARASLLAVGLDQDCEWLRSIFSQAEGHSGQGQSSIHVTMPCLRNSPDNSKPPPTLRPRFLRVRRRSENLPSCDAITPHSYCRPQHSLRAHRCFRLPEDL